MPFVPTIQEGDVLLFFANPSFFEQAIDFGERLEDGSQPKFYYHVAVATGNEYKIEALSRVYQTSISYDGSYDVFRPPIPKTNIREGLQYLRTTLGERYDWLLILDDALRYISKGLLHLPRQWVRSAERQRKICSSLVQDYFKETGWNSGLKSWPPPSPEDVYVALKQYQVNG